VAEEDVEKSLTPFRLTRVFSSASEVEESAGMTSGLYLEKMVWENADNREVSIDLERCSYGVSSVDKARG
jgi:hypothetical protein